jgi:hypothetical protein
MGNALNSADEDGQGSMSWQKNWPSVIARRQRQVTNAGLASAGCDGPAYHPVTQVRPAGSSDA